MARYLVTGGAGYVGSHCALALVQRGDEVVVLDDLRQGHRDAVPDGAELVVADLADRQRVEEVFAAWRFDGVLHFAALSLVGESMREPLRYCAENTANGLWLADAAVRAGVRRFILSSTANLFGAGGGEGGLLHEDAPIEPGSAYGESKLMVERGLEWAGRVHGLGWAALRYFNAAGADPAGRLGEDHDPETHLIPLCIDAALGRRRPLVVFGEDYPTPDGTPIRDYVHVMDLATAHLALLDRPADQRHRYNVGNGLGHSVRDVMASVKRVTGQPVPHSVGPRREGDPATLVAANTRLREETGWVPRYPELDTIVRHAFTWRKTHPRGYDDRGTEGASSR